MNTADTLESQKKTFYDVLQISRNATPDEIKAAYRSLILCFHPDKSLQSGPISSETTNENAVNEGNSMYMSSLELKLCAIDLDDDDVDGDVGDFQCNNGMDVAAYKPLINSTSQIPSLPDHSLNNQNNLSPSSTMKQQEVGENNKTFLEIQAAYNCLRDSCKRREYDESLRRDQERDKWRYNGAVEVRLSEMEYEYCCVEYEDESNGHDTTSKKNQSVEDYETQSNLDQLQKVYFYPCRCGDTFQITIDELRESLIEDNSISGNFNRILSDCVWQCDSCSLSIRIHVDKDL
ncbi:hypothetical protein ACHAXS_012632 [Conticribra weissflogii]